MGRTIQLIRGTSSQNNNYTGPEGSLSYDTDTRALRVHDGQTVGGGQIASSFNADFVVYWDAQYAPDHSHAKPGIPTPTNNGWYRLYSSGWVEQGGTNLSVDANGAFCTVTLFIELLNTNYTVLYQAGTSTKQWATNQVVNPQILNKTTTSFVCIDNLYYNTKANWYVASYAA